MAEPTLEERFGALEAHLKTLGLTPPPAPPIPAEPVIEPTAPAAV